MNNLRPKYSVKRKKIVGRGGKRGTTSGRGTKGQRARAGRKLRPEWREVIKKRPKLRGHRSGHSVSLKLRRFTAVVNLDLLNRHFNAGEQVTPESLLARGLIKKVSGRLPKVKILGSGQTAKPLIVKDCLLSESARRKLKAEK